MSNLVPKHPNYTILRHSIPSTTPHVNSARRFWIDDSSLVIFVSDWSILRLWHRLVIVPMLELWRFTMRGNMSALVNTEVCAGFTSGVSTGSLLFIGWNMKPYPIRDLQEHDGKVTQLGKWNSYFFLNCQSEMELYIGNGELTKTENAKWNHFLLKSHYFIFMIIHWKL